MLKRFKGDIIILIAAVLSVIGFYFISFTGGFEALSKGDILLLIGAGTCVIFVAVIMAETGTSEETKNI